MSSREVTHRLLGDPKMTATENKLVALFKQWDETARGIFYGEENARSMVNDVSEDFAVRTVDEKGKATDEFYLTVNDEGVIFWHDFTHTTEIGNVKYDALTWDFTQNPA